MSLVFCPKMPGRLCWAENSRNSPNSCDIVEGSRHSILCCPRARKFYGNESEIESVKKALIAATV